MTITEASASGEFLLASWNYDHPSGDDLRFDLWTYEGHFLVVFWTEARGVLWNGEYHEEDEWDDDIEQIVMDYDELFPLPVQYDWSSEGF